MFAGVSLACEVLDPPVKRSEVPGNYTFEEKVIRSRHGKETLTLRDDGTFVQSYTAPGKTIHILNEGAWKFDSSHSPELDVRHYRAFGSNIWREFPGGSDLHDRLGLPVDWSEGCVRIIVSDDKGQYYFKDPENH